MVSLPFIPGYSGDNRLALDSSVQIGPPETGAFDISQARRVQLDCLVIERQVLRKPLEGSLPTRLIVQLGGGFSTGAKLKGWRRLSLGPNIF